MSAFVLRGLIGGRGTRMLLLAWIGALGLGFPMAGNTADETMPERRFEQATFTPAPCGDNAAGETVSLPDLWSRRNLIRTGAACYRIRFDMDTAPSTEVQSLRVDRLSTTHTIKLNGVLVSQVTSFRYPAYVDGAPRLFELPRGALRQGPNELELGVVIAVPVRAGLSPVVLGPVERLRPEYESAVFWTTRLPQSINLAVAGLALMLLLVWRERRQDRVFLHFGGLLLVASLRNYIYFLDTPVISAAVNDWLLYAANLWSLALLAAFASSFSPESASDTGQPRIRRMVDALRRLGVLVSVVLPCVAIVSIRQGWFRSLRTYSYPVAIALGVAAMIFIVIEARRRGKTAFATLMVAMALLAISVTHDYLLIGEAFGLVVYYWLPFTLPVLLAAYALLLVKQLVSAMNAFESLTATLESRVLERTRELRDANAAKTRFLAAASHDLRQPLHAIGLLIGLLAERIRYPEVRTLVQKIEAAVDSMGSLLKGLLDLSRLDAKAVPVATVDVAVAELFSAVEDVEAPLAHAKGLSIRFARCSAIVRTDRTLAESMLRNLVANATRYTERGRILVGVRRRGGALLVQVHDTGIGVSAEHADLIFREFYQVANSARDRTMGLGLGLSIVKRTAELLGHPLRFRSTPGKGSTFEFEMPLACGESTSRLIVPLPLPYRDAPMQGCFVVIIEDDAAVREALEALMLAWACHVVASKSAEAALAMLAQHLREPDLIVCDYRLGDDENGIDAIRAVRQACGNEIPALLVTGGMASAELRAVEVTRFPVLFKPVRANELREACLRQLEKKARSS